MAHTVTGTVVSNKMQKTLVVEISRKMRHPVYHKVITRTKRLKVHCDDSSVKVGDLITIAETRPISKDTHFTFVGKAK